jgi:hypothetical protein
MIREDKAVHLYVYCVCWNVKFLLMPIYIAIDMDDPGVGWALVMKEAL